MKKETENVTAEESVNTNEEVVDTVEEVVDEAKKGTEEAKKGAEKAKSEEEKMEQNDGAEEAKKGTEMAKNDADELYEKERVMKDLEIESLKMEVELLKGRVLNVKDYMKLAMLMVVAVIFVVSCILGILKVRETMQVRNNIASNPIYENLVAEDGKENLNKNVSTFNEYYGSISGNSIYGEAQRMDGAYYMTSICGNGEMIYTDNSSFVSFIDADGKQYRLEADNEGNFVPSDGKVISPIKFLKYMLDNEKGKAYHFAGEEENGTLYFEMSDKEFKRITEDFLNNMYGTEVLWEDFLEFIGMSSKYADNPHNMIVGAGFYEDGVIIDFIYVGEEEYLPMYEVTYFDKIKSWELGIDWYKQNSDKEKLASDKLVEVLGYMDELYQKYQAEYETSVSENSAE